VVGDRPAFGTVLISKAKFQGGYVHAGQYVTKYLTKIPENGLPEWVMQIGEYRRIRRYSTSRGFWNNPPKPKSSSNSEARIQIRITYALRIKKCGMSVNLFEIETVKVPDSEESIANRVWVGQLDIDSKTLFEGLWDPGNPQRQRRSLLALSLPHVEQIIEIVIGRKVKWLRTNKTKINSYWDEKIEHFRRMKPWFGKGKCNGYVYERQELPRDASMHR